MSFLEKCFFSEVSHFCNFLFGFGRFGSNVIVFKSTGMNEAGFFTNELYMVINIKACAIKIRRNMVKGYTVA